MLKLQNGGYSRLEREYIELKEDLRIIHEGVREVLTSTSYNETRRRAKVQRSQSLKPYNDKMNPIEGRLDAIKSEVEQKLMLNYMVP